MGAAPLACGVGNAGLDGANGISSEDVPALLGKGMAVGKPAGRAGAAVGTGAAVVGAGAAAVGDEAAAEVLLPPNGMAVGKPAGRTGAAVGAGSAGSPGSGMGVGKPDAGASVTVGGLAGAASGCAAGGWVGSSTNGVGDGFKGAPVGAGIMEISPASVLTEVGFGSPVGVASTGRLHPVRRMLNKKRALRIIRLVFIFSPLS